MDTAVHSVCAVYVPLITDTIGGSFSTPARLGGVHNKRRRSVGVVLCFVSLIAERGFRVK